MKSSPKTILLNTKIGRRTLGLFALCALIPIVIMAFQNQREVSSIYEDQLINELNSSAKNLGLTLFERLKYIDQQLTEHYLSSSPIPSVQINGTKTTRVFSELFWLMPEHPQHHAIQQQLDVIDDRHNGGWQTLLKIESTDGEPEFWLYKRLRDTGTNSILSASINADELWQDFELYDSSKIFLIYDDIGRLLFESVSGINTKPFSPEDYKGQWKLFLDSAFSMDSWTIESINNDDTIFAKRDSFQLTIALTTCLSLLLAGFVGSYAIRKNTAPIEALKQGIMAINGNNFTHQVSIKSGDEFELLGDTFNTMTNRLGRHIHAIESLAKIDQLILHRFKNEDIIKAVLNEGTALLNATQVIFLIRSEQSNTFQIYSSLDWQAEITFPKESLQDLKRERIQRPNNFILPDKIKNSFQESSWVFSSSLFHEDEIRGILMVEFAHYPEEDIANIGTTFVDHVHVALTNADWEERLFQQAHFDTLTDLPNRFYFNTYLENLVQQAHNSDGRLALYIVDLDNFKSINDATGHEAGDQILVSIANKLKSFFGEQHFIGRLSGDEFVMIQIFDETQSHTHILSQASLIAEKIRSICKEAIVIKGMEIRITLSTGVAFLPFDSESGESLLHHADVALDEAKAAGKNTFHFYSEIDNDSASASIQLIGDMRRAIIEDEFELYYQPKINPITGSIDGCEALIRWHHPTRGFLGPGSFIPLAEESELIHHVGRWVIQKAAEQQSIWLNSGHLFGRIAVNISALHLIQDDFQSDFHSILEQTGCPGSMLEIELTETAYVEDMERIRLQMMNLSETGVIFSVDDYGTGHSALSLLLNMPISRLKIDKSFIDDIHNSSTRCAIVESTVSLAQKVGLKIVAEGVESWEQLSVLSSFGCDSIQGYYFSKPVPASELETMMEEGYFQPKLHFPIQSIVKNA